MLDKISWQVYTYCHGKILTQHCHFGPYNISGLEDRKVICEENLKRASFSNWIHIDQLIEKR